MNLQNMIDSAKTRESEVFVKFQQYDIDGSGAIDEGELACLLDDLSMLSGDPAKDQKFLTQQFMAADENGDGVISFEEFKVFYNAAIDLKNGKSPAKGKTPIKGKDSKALSSDVNAARKAAAERRAEEKAAAAQKLAAENRERKKRLAEARSKGKNDVVGLYKFKAVDP